MCRVSNWGEKKLITLDSLKVRTRFPIRTEVAVLRGIRGTPIQRLLTAAWDLVVDRIHHNSVEAMTPLPSGVNTPSFEYIAYSFTVEIRVLAGEIVTLMDLLSVLASTYDQMDERLGFGTAFMSVYNGAQLVALGVIKRS